MNIDGLIEKFRQTVASHRLAEGEYARWLWQNRAGERELGINEYGCADAANILYTIGDFPRDPGQRAAFVRALQRMQDPQTGLFTEKTHHPIHTTAHCLAALELFDAQPLYPLTALLPYLDKERMEAFLSELDWQKRPWPQSHQGAGLYAAMVITRTADARWQAWYFDWLRARTDPVCGMSPAGAAASGGAPLFEHMCGWFHYFFNHAYARMPIPHPERLIDSCLAMYRENALGPRFGEMVGFKEIDWVFCVSRGCRQTGYRFEECREALASFEERYITWLNALPWQTDDEFNDLHMLFGAVCAVAELQQALPGTLTSTVPLRLVLDRRPFI